MARRLKRGELFIPEKVELWVGDPGNELSPTLCGPEDWPALVLDDEASLGSSTVGLYLYRKILLATGRVVEVYPSLLEM